MFSGRCAGVGPLLNQQLGHLDVVVHGSSSCGWNQQVADGCFSAPSAWSSAACRGLSGPGKVRGRPARQRVLPGRQRRRSPPQEEYTMTTTTERPRRNGVDVATLFATLDAVKGQTRDREVPVPGPQHLAERHPQPHGDLRLLRRHAGDGAQATSPWSTATTPRCSSARDHAPTPVEYLLHAIAACLTVRHRQHRLRPRRGPHQGQLDGRGRHQPARHPRSVRRHGPQRLRAAEGHVPHRRRRRRGDPARDRRAVAPAARPSTTH